MEGDPRLGQAGAGRRRVRDGRVQERPGLPQGQRQGGVQRVRVTAADGCVEHPVQLSLVLAGLGRGDVSLRVGSPGQAQLRVLGQRLRGEDVRGHDGQRQPVLSGALDARADDQGEQGLCFGVGVPGYEGRLDDGIPPQERPRGRDQVREGDEGCGSARGQVSDWVARPRSGPWRTLRSGSGRRYAPSGGGARLPARRTSPRSARVGRQSAARGARVVARVARGRRGRVVRPRWA